MKKKLTFVLSLILILSICVSSFITPASSFEHHEITSSYAMLLINLNTNTVVYSQAHDKYWHASYMSELVTFLLLTEKVADPEKVTVKVDEDFINDLPHSDGCLKQYLGDDLTLRDLAAIMLLTGGSDAAYLIADHLSDGDIDAFVAEMNDRCQKLGCKLTAFLTPGYSESKQHYTTCQDLSLIYKAVMDNELYQEIMSSPTYIPERYDNDEEYAVTTENSIMNPASPYYFRYVTGGKYAYDKPSGASLVVKTSYKDIDYLFVALRGKNESEQNVFADARRMTTWAYLNLSDRKVINTDQSIGSTALISPWGEYSIDLYADNSAFKTLPNDYDQKLFKIKLDIPKSVNLPVFEDQVIGKADIYYGREHLDKVDIVSQHDEGVSLLNDLGRFGGYALAKLFPNIPGAKSEEKATEPATEKATAAPKKAPKKQKATKPAATEAAEAQEEPEEYDEAEE